MMRVRPRIAPARHYLARIVISSQCSLTLRWLCPWALDGLCCWQPAPCLWLHLWSGPQMQRLSQPRAGPVSPQHSGDKWHIIFGLTSTCVFTSLCGVPYHAAYLVARPLPTLPVPLLPTSPCNHWEPDGRNLFATIASQ
jgi:hypothetical protein